eukprot:TRINITY_DN1245_c0_g1_i5.p1 TRINITY_DN1245_c0_g1~~TRINITY_DN1245_c0_g1_i5.p1  ORF type:complete len:293 (+),score=96.50 TRINITY_DN1245_c0_g1_i5:115-993(+)
MCGRKADPGMSGSDNSLNNFRSQLQVERQLREAQAEAFGSELARFEQEQGQLLYCEESAEPELLKAAAPPRPREMMQEETLMPDQLKAAAPPPPHSYADEQKDEDELPPLEDFPAPETLKAAAPPQQETPKTLPTPQARKLPAPPSEQRRAPPSLEASGTLQVPKTPERVRDRRSAEEVLRDAGVPLEPEALLRALISPSGMNMTSKQAKYPVQAPETEEDDPAAVQMERQEAMSKLLTNRLKLNMQHDVAEEPPEEDPLFSEKMRRYEEELHVQQEGAMKNTLQLIVKALS